MGDWLGTGTVWNGFRMFRPFRDARAFARELKLKTEAEWLAYCRGQMPHLGPLPADIPVHAARTYAGKGWKSVGDWLGTGTVATGLRKFRPFREARAFARRLRLQSQREWIAYCKGEIPRLGRCPADIPASPAAVYSDKGWKGYGDWLGKDDTH